MKISTFESAHLQVCVGVTFEVVTDKDRTQLAVTALVLPISVWGHHSPKC